MTLESSLARRFNDIGVDESDLPYDLWSKFWFEEAVLIVRWVETPSQRVKLVALLKEMPEIK